MYWNISGLPSGATPENTLINNHSYSSFSLPMLYTTVGQKVFSADISGKTTSGATFSGTCNGTTTVIMGNGGFQEI